MYQVIKMYQMYQGFPRYRVAALPLSVGYEETQMTYRPKPVERVIEDTIVSAPFEANLFDEGGLEMKVKDFVELQSLRRETGFDPWPWITDRDSLKTAQRMHRWRPEFVDELKVPPVDVKQ